ncbi:hypothetical protein EAI_08016, partial [Harpegnathos saltator]
KKFKQAFSRDWLENDNYKSWMKEVPENCSKYFCQVCNKMFSCSSRVSRHAESTLHRNNALQNRNQESSPPFTDRKEIAEIKCVALIAEKNILFQTAEIILSFSQDVGKNSAVLQSMTMHRKKVPKIINVLYAREQERLVEKLQNNKFSIFIVEPSDITNDKWMTFLVRYV